MVNIIVSLGRNGIQDWFLQRVSAIILALYFSFIAIFIYTHPAITFDAWYELYDNTWVKFATLFALISLIIHAWIGMVIVVTDYIKPISLRILLHILIISFLVVCFVFGIIILWSI